MCRGVFFAAQKEPWCDLLSSNAGTRYGTDNRGSLTGPAVEENHPPSPHVIVELVTESDKDGSPPPSYPLHPDEKGRAVPQVSTKKHCPERKFKRLFVLLLILLYVSIATNVLAMIRIWRMRSKGPKMVTAVEVRAKGPGKIARNPAHKVARRVPPHGRCRNRQCNP